MKHYLTNDQPRQIKEKKILYTNSYNPLVINYADGSIPTFYYSVHNRF